MNALPVRAMHLALAVATNAGAASAVAADFVQEPDQAIEIPRPPWMDPSPPEPPPAVAPDRPVLPPIIDPPTEEVQPPPAPRPQLAPSPPPAPAPGGGGGGAGQQRPAPDTPRRLPAAPETPQNAVFSSAGRWTYAGASFGASRWNIKDPNGIRVDESGSVLKLFAGHRYGSWRRAQVGAEVGFVDLGKASQDSGATGVVTHFKVNGLYLDGVLGQTVWPRVWVQGQLGLFYGRSDTSPGSRSASVGLKWGAGAAYELTPRWSLRGDWESYPVKAKEVSDTSRSNVSALTIGIRYRF